MGGDRRPVHRRGARAAASGPGPWRGHHYALVVRGGAGAGHQHAVRRAAGRRGGLAAARTATRRRRASARSDPDRPLRLAFGSCRYATPPRSTGDKHFDADALDTFARRMMATAAGRPLARRAGPARRPGLRRRDLRGDVQRADPRAARHRRDPPGDQVRDFEEYTWLYDESWRDPQVRWLLSTMPTLDDLRRPRRARRLEHLRLLAPRDAGDVVVGGAGHRRPVVVLGLPAPRQPLARRRWPRTTSTSGCGRTTATRAAAARVRRGRRQGGRRAQGRAVVLPARPGRRAAAGGRLPLRADARQRRPLDGLRRRVRAGSRSRSPATTTTCWSAPRCRGCSPRALHDLESWDERAGAPATRGRALARLGEKVRRGRRPRALGGVPGSPSTGSPTLFAQVGRGDHAGAGRHGRRPRSACCPATSTTPTPRRRTTASR